MEISDLQALIHITNEIETQGYTVRSIESEEKYTGSPTLEIKVLFSRKRKDTRFMTESSKP